MGCHLQQYVVTNKDAAPTSRNNILAPSNWSHNHINGKGHNGHILYRTHHTTQLPFLPPPKLSCMKLFTHKSNLSDFSVDFLLLNRIVLSLFLSNFSQTLFLSTNTHSFPSTLYSNKTETRINRLLG